MNFEEYWKQIYIEEEESDYSFIQKTWNTCKNEVLKILRDKNNNDIYDTDGGCVSAISISVIREVEEL